MNTRSDRTFRADIQVLRGIALLLVIVEHYFRPRILPGAFVAIDIFFVISGYLVLGSLLRAAREGRRISLSSFYVRRARRVLPASLVVALITFLVFGGLLNPLRVDAYGHQLVACALFFGNFVLRQQQGGYFTPVDPSPYLHFWSLGVEEQFYFLAPLLVVGVFAVPLLRRRVIVLVAVAAAVSFSMAVWVSRDHATFAYFMLPTRAWEIAVGGLAVFVSVPERRRRQVLLAGVATLIAGVCAARPELSVPGYGVLAPVLGTAAILAAGAAAERGSSDQDFPPLRALVWLGDASYSIYLWHWAPLCWLMLSANGQAIPLRELIAALALSFALAVLTYRYVEQPFRYAQWTVRLPRATIALGIAAACAVALVGVSASVWKPRLTSTRAAQPLVETEVLARPLAGPSFVPMNVVPALRNIGQLNRLYSGCHNSQLNPEIRPCLFGAEDAPQTVLLAGDSHAAHWLDALDIAGKRLGFKLITLTKSSCPVEPLSPAIGISPSCRAWRNAVGEYIQRTRPEVVVFGSGAFAFAPPEVPRSQFLAGVERAWSTLLAKQPSGVQEFIIGDVPRPPHDIAGCLARNLTNTTPCEFVLDPLHIEIADIERAVVSDSGAGYIQTDLWLCDGRCSMLAGNVVIYRDAQGHLTPEASRLLAPRMEQALRPALRESRLDEGS